MKKNSNILMYSKEAVKRNGRLYCEGIAFKATRVAYVIVAAYSVMMFAAMIIGCAFTMSEYGEKLTTDAASKVNEASMQLWSMVIALVATAVCIVFMKLKLALPLAVSGCVNCVIAFVVFYGPSVKNDIKNGGQALFWGTFGVPAIIVAVLSLAMACLMIIDSRRIGTEYERFASELYSKYSENGEKSLSEEEFGKVMDEYEGEELFRTDIPLKKSLRRRRLKQEKRMAEAEARKTENE